MQPIPFPPTVDMTGKQAPLFEKTGHLYVKRQLDQDYWPKFAKAFDVGLDLPVKININRIKLTNSGEEIDRLREPMLYPDLRQYIFPEGSKDEPLPYLEIPALGWAEVPAALAVKIPDDAWGLLMGRSWSNWRKHLIVRESVIDPGYIGLLGTLVWNPNTSPVRVREFCNKTGQGDKLGQLILIPRYNLEKVVLVDELPQTERGDTGFGSSSGASGVLKAII